MIDVEIESLKQQVHSGMWGGPVYDPAMELCRLLSSLTTPDGRIAIDGIYDNVMKLDDNYKKRIDSLPFDKELFIKGFKTVVGNKGSKTIP